MSTTKIPWPHLSAAKDPKTQSALSRPGPLGPPHWQRPAGKASGNRRNCRPRHWGQWKGCWFTESQDPCAGHTDRWCSHHGAPPRSKLQHATAPLPKAALEYEWVQDPAPSSLFLFRTTPFARRTGFQMRVRPSWHGGTRMAANPRIREAPFRRNGPPSCSKAGNRFRVWREAASPTKRGRQFCGHH